MLFSPSSIRPPWGLKAGAGLVLATMLAVLLAGRAAGQDSPVPSLIEQGRRAGADATLMRTVADRAQAAGLSSRATADLLHPAVRLAEQDLPSTPLLNKVLEGLAKRVPPARMTPVLQSLQGHTEWAGTLVTDWLAQESVRSMVTGAQDPPPRPEVDALVVGAAEARQQGMSPSAIEDFLASIPDATQRRPIPLSEIATATSVLSDLPGRVVSSRTGHQLLTSALNAGYDSESLRQLPAAMKQAQRQNQRPFTAIAQRASQAIAQGTPAARVLQSLFQGGMPGTVGGGPPGAGNGPPGALPGQGPPSDPPGKGPPDDPPGNGPPDDPPGGGGR